MLRKLSRWIAPVVLCVLGISQTHAADDRVSVADLTEAKQFDQAFELVRSGAPVDGRQADGMTALHWAVFHGQSDLVKALLNRKVDPNASSSYDVPPLVIACQNGDIACAGLLIDAGAAVDVELRGGESALMVAARTGVPGVVKKLIEAGADVNHADKRKQTAVMWAAAEGNVEAVSALIEAGADYEKSLSTGFTAFLFAVREGKSEVVEKFIALGVDVNAPMNPRNTGGRNPRRGMAALHLAIENGHFELASKLLDAGADPNDQRGGFTPLHYLSWVRKPDRGDNIDGAPAPIGSGNMTSLQLVERLVASGANVDARLKRGSAGRAKMNQEGATPFLFAARRNDVPFMKKLLELGADPTIPNADNCTPLLVAAGIGTMAPGEEAGTEDEALESVKLLLSLGADINHVDDNGETAMHGAAYKSLPRMIAFLGENGADINVWNQKNKYGWTPTLIAEGHRVGNFKPAAETLEAVYVQLRAAGVDPPPLTPPKHRLGYDQP